MPTKKKREKLNVPLDMWSQWKQYMEDNKLTHSVFAEMLWKSLNKKELFEVAHEAYQKDMEQVLDTMFKGGVDREAVKRLFEIFWVAIMRIYTKKLDGVVLGDLIEPLLNDSRLDPKATKGKIESAEAYEAKIMKLRESQKQKEEI